MTSAAFLRRDARQPLEMRGKELKLSELNTFDGSCWFSQGLSSVLVTVHGPATAKVEDYEKCVLRVSVQHASAIPSAGGAERVNVLERRRAQTSITDANDLLSVLERTVNAVVMTEAFPRCVLAIDVVIMYEDGSLPAVAVNAVMCALLDAGVPCRTTMAAVSLAVIADLSPSASAATSSSSASTTASKNADTKPAPKSAAKAKAHDAPMKKIFLLDPTQLEETLGVNVATTDNAAASSSPSSSLAVLSPSTTPHVCVATATFVFANPNCGGGLLASDIRRSRAAVRLSTHASSAAAAMALPSPSQMNLSEQEVLDMMALAERAAPALFHFFRQCNVPLQ